MFEGVEVMVIPGERVTFALVDERIIVYTNLQTFALVGNNKRMGTVRALIRLGRINNLSDLAEFCKESVEWTPIHKPAILT